MIRESIPEGSWLKNTCGHWGNYSVYFFFIVSGMLMANSISKKNISEKYGKASIDFVLKKYLSISWPLIISIVLCLFTTVTIRLQQGKIQEISNVVDAFLNAIPELFMVSRSGVGGIYNVPVWYISAMLLCMLPLAYMLYRKNNFTLYVFSPLVALFVLGYMCQENKYGFFAQDKNYGLFMGGILRAMSGLCFGICAYTIYNKIRNLNPNKKMRIFLMVSEVLLYSLFFIELFKPSSNQAMMSVSLLLPIAVAITFSGKSYAQNLFKFKWMKCFAPLSLYLYLNHWVVRKICEAYFINKGIRLRVIFVLTVGLTIAFSILNYAIVYFGKMLWERKLKPAFKKPD